MATWSHFRELWDDLGVSRGRLVAEYPANWRDQICQLALNNPPVKAGSIMARLKPTPGLGAIRKWVPTGRPFDKGKDWLTNAESHQGASAFDAIVATNNPRNKNRVLIAGEFPKDQAPWKVEGQIEIPRTAEKLLECARFLLQASDELILVDPNFDAIEARFRDPFGELVRVRPAGKSWKRCELHVAHPLDKGQLDKNVLANRIAHMKQFLPGLIPAGTVAKVYFWARRPGGKRLHPRFILTDIGGIQPDYGLDEGDSLNDTTIVALLGHEVWQLVKADYCHPSPSFDITADCVVPIPGEA